MLDNPVKSRFSSPVLLFFYLLSANHNKLRIVDYWYFDPIDKPIIAKVYYPPETPLFYSFAAGLLRNCVNFFKYCEVAVILS